jgi:hypothetical protein
VTNEVLIEGGFIHCIGGEAGMPASGDALREHPSRPSLLNWAPCYHGRSAENSQDFLRARVGSPGAELRKIRIRDD